MLSNGFFVCQRADTLLFIYINGVDLDDFIRFGPSELLKVKA